VDRAYRATQETMEQWSRFSERPEDLLAILFWVHTPVLTERKFYAGIRQRRLCEVLHGQQRRGSRRSRRHNRWLKASMGRCVWALTEGERAGQGCLASVATAMAPETSSVSDHGVSK
jgi:hypothetical protein